LVTLNPVLQKILYAVIALVLGFVFDVILRWLLKQRHKRKPFMIAGMPLQIEEWAAPLRMLMPALFLRAALPLMELSDTIEPPLAHIIDLWIIGAAAWLMRRMVIMIRKMAVARFPVDVKDNLEARRIQTQFRVFERVATGLIVVATISIMLMTFQQVRQFGVSLLASAGLAGIVIGFAAQKSLGTLLAGIQIAFSQPIRIDDVVIVGGEWGRIEEITLTYVVVKIWDERRLVVPITYFIDNVFQNWTRTSAQLLGTVFLYADYNIPVEEVRQELRQILESTNLWDGRVCVLQVTDANEKSVELRALMSAEDSSKAWDLRCYVREKLITFMQEQFPESLPRLRVQSESTPIGG
jgi:small-conductance mechanosensitive channel